MGIWIEHRNMHPQCVGAIAALICWGEKKIDQHAGEVLRGLKKAFRSGTGIDAGGTFVFVQKYLGTTCKRESYFLLPPIGDFFSKIIFGNVEYEDT